MTLPSTTELDNSIKSIWDFGNKILYDLCKNNFDHLQDEYVLTKVLFIGRIYAAAIERRKNKTNNINDSFYVEIVAPKFRHSNIDNILGELSKEITISFHNVRQILEAHSFLTRMLKEITELEKRSFSSKYLHFHLPDFFYIYDSRAVNALRSFKIKIPAELTELVNLKSVDKEYASFFFKCFILKRKIQDEFNITLSNRQLDNLLIERANKKQTQKLQQK